MREAYYTAKLYPLMDQVLALVQQGGGDFYLTGGTALSRGYLNHRYSDDLDLFVNALPEFHRQATAVVAALSSTFGVTLGAASESFLRVFLHDKDLTLKLDLVNDIAAHFGEVVRVPFFHRIDSWRNILSNKLCALSRADAKDLADIVCLAGSFPFQWEQIFKEARQKDLWVEPLSVAALLKSFPPDQFQAIRWTKPVAMERIAQALQVLHDDIFFGRPNSLDGEFPNWLKPVDQSE
jgi:hypothetical protein